MHLAKNNICRLIAFYKLLRFCLSIYLILSFGLFARSLDITKNPKALLDSVQKSVVSINVQVIKVAYTINNLANPLGSGIGTGFIIDKERGWILTNKHISDVARIEHLEVSFFNGKETKAELLYSDPWHDFAILSVTPKEIPNDAKAIVLSDSSVKMSQPVFMVGSNEGQAFSLQTGIVSSVYQSFGFFPNQSIRISLNSKGGSSGSPVCNEAGEAIALQCGGNDTFAHALPINYVLDVLPSIKKNITPQRRDTGAMLVYYSLDKAVRFFNFPQAQVEEYTKNFPDAKNNALMVSDIFEDAPANKVLKIGDIIWLVDDKKIGPNLHQIQKIFNENKTVKLSVYRNGRLENLEVETYDLEGTRLKAMISFGGAMFFKADDLSRLLVDAKLGEVLIGYVQPGSSFESIAPAVPFNGHGTFLLRLLKINGQAIDKLETFARLIPDLLSKKDLLIEYKNYLVEPYYNNSFRIERRNALSDVRYSGYDDVPTYFKYGEKKRQWEKSLINVQQATSTKTAE